MQPDRLQLRRGALQFDLRPRYGARCDALRWQTPDMPEPLDLLSAQTPRSAETLHSACFALLPYSNRLSNAQLRTPDGVLLLPPNLDHLPVPVHGLGWRMAWTVIDRGSDHVGLGCEHHGDDHWPYAFDALQSIRLGDDTVRFELAVHNRDKCAMPLGLGWHPCFAIDADTQVRCDTTGGWLLDGDGRPLRHVAPDVEPRFDFRRPRRADGVVLNHCLSGWSGIVDIARPAHGLTLRMVACDALRHLVIYRTTGQPWLCIEPVSHATGALSLDRLSHATHGARMVEPGQGMQAWMELRVVTGGP